MTNWNSLFDLVSNRNHKRVAFEGVTRVKPLCLCSPTKAIIAQIANCWARKCIRRAEIVTDFVAAKSDLVRASTGYILEKCCFRDRGQKTKKTKGQVQHAPSICGRQWHSFVQVCDNWTLVTLLGMRFFPKSLYSRRGEHLNRWHLLGKKVACVQQKKQKQKRFYPKQNLTASARVSNYAV